jgi:hypothetical protein
MDTVMGDDDDVIVDDVALAPSSACSPPSPGSPAEVSEEEADRCRIHH